MRAFSFSLVIFLVGCGPSGFGPGAQDFIVRVAGDYSIQRTSAHEIQIAPDVWNASTPIIPTKVIECNTDGRYIIAKRQGLKRRIPNNPNDTYEVPDPSVIDYWILDTTTPKVYGPLTLQQFKVKTTDIGVAPSLRLKDVYSFRP